MRNRFLFPVFLVLIAVLAPGVSMAATDTSAPDPADQEAPGTPATGGDQVDAEKRLAAERRIGDLEAELARAEASRRDNLGKIEQLDQRFDNLRKQAAALQTRLDERERELTAAHAMQAEQAAGLKAANEAMEKLEANVAASDTALATARSDLAVRDASLQEVQALYDENATRLQAMARRLETAEDDAEVLRGRLEKGQAQAQARIAELETAMRELLRSSLIRIQDLPDERTRIRMSGDRVFLGEQPMISPEGLSMLSEVVNLVRAAPPGQIRVEVHQDRDGAPQGLRHDRDLTRARAESVVAQLGRLSGLPVQRFTAIGDGSGRPIASNSTQSGRALNRRVEIYLPPGPGLIVPEPPLRMPMNR
ncbi:MAG: OmpA family protein [Gammaproteobacteria bacterium]|nr:OmpA family protein [Gammaproteobacteria bacterium]MCP5136289.1 OmpA family protein [Gammaproteobacteria bacterium]